MYSEKMKSELKKECLGFVKRLNEIFGEIGGELTIDEMRDIFKVIYECESRFEVYSINGLLKS